MNNGAPNEVRHNTLLYFICIYCIVLTMYYIMFMTFYTCHLKFMLYLYFVNQNILKLYMFHTYTFFHIYSLFLQGPGNIPMLPMLFYFSHTFFIYSFLYLCYHILTSLGIQNFFIRLNINAD